MLLLQKYLIIMKNIKHILFLTIICLLFIDNSHAQRIKGVIIGGVNTTQVDGDEIFGYYKWGFNVGASAVFPFGKHWSLGVETIFTQKGSYQNEPNSTDTLGKPYYNLRLNYAEVPVLLMYEDKNTITFGAGFAWGRLVSVTEVEHGLQTKSTTLSGPYERDDFSVLFDLRFKIYQGLKLNFRYEYSMIPIRHRSYDVVSITGIHSSWDRYQYNSMLTLRLLYIFNEPRDINKDNNQE